MVSFPPEHCPYCGTELSTTDVDGESRDYCGGCERVVWHNPVPTVGVLVVADGRVLLVERARGETAGDWMVPGGHVEIGEHPDEAAARELEEETGLRVDPGGLSFALARQSESAPGKHCLSIEYAARRTAVDGDPVPGSDAAAARFWKPGEFADAGAALRPQHDRRFGTADLSWLVERAREAVEQ